MVSEQVKSTMMNELLCALSAGQDKSKKTYERLSLLFDMSNEQVVITDSRGIIVYANSTTEKMTGFSLDEVIGQTPALWRPEEGTATESFWSTIVINKKPYRDTVLNVHKDGTLYEAEVQVTPVHNDDGDVDFFFYIERDVSFATALERIQRRVIALTSHNLKTPLAGIRWQVEMLRDGEMGSVSKDQKESLEDVLEGVINMVKIVDQWFDVTNLDMGLRKPMNEPVVLDTVVEEVLDELKLRIEQEGVSVQFTPNSPPFSIVADALSMRTIVHALIFNAVKYNRENGTVDVEVMMLQAQSEYAGRTFPENRIILSVRDTGLGIPNEEQEKVFRECFHASNVSELQAGGAGLGLYTVFKLVHTMAGDVWFTSSEKGSHFTVAIPSNNPVT